MDKSDSELLEIYVTALQRAMWADGGLLRAESTLRDGLHAQAKCGTGIEHFRRQKKGSRRLLEAESLSRVARTILCSAIARKESRGAHYRNDFPTRDDVNFQKHSVYASDGSVRFESW
jgi:succinate dehydrogenase / fumarate reductase flavoprotein subunit